MPLVQVLDFELQRQLVPHMKDLEPLPGIYDPDFIAANQGARANNVIKGTRQEQVDAVRQHIRAFQADSAVDKVIVLWTANTERFGEVSKLNPCLAPWLACGVKSLDTQAAADPNTGGPSTGTPLFWHHEVVQRADGSVTWHSQQPNKV